MAVEDGAMPRLQKNQNLQLPETEDDPPKIGGSSWMERSDYGESVITSGSIIFRMLRMLD